MHLLQLACPAAVAVAVAATVAAAAAADCHQVAKICNNLAMAIEMAGVSEALALGAAQGLDPARLTAVMNNSSAACWSTKLYNPVPVSGLCCNCNTCNSCK